MTSRYDDGFRRRWLSHSRLRDDDPKDDARGNRRRRIRFLRPAGDDDDRRRTTLTLTFVVSTTTGWDVHLGGRSRREVRWRNRDYIENEEERAWDEDEDGLTGGVGGGAARYANARLSMPGMGGTAGRSFSHTSPEREDGYAREDPRAPPPPRLPVRFNFVNESVSTLVRWCTVGVS
jgi:hypothetical protein